MCTFWTFFRAVFRILFAQSGKAYWPSGIARSVVTFSILIIKITISSIVIGLKKLLFSTNSLAKLLSDSLLSDSLLLDSLLSDSSISQSDSKL